MGAESSRGTGGTSSLPSQEQFDELMRKRPWLAADAHYLGPQAKEVRECLESGSDCSDKMERLKREIQFEEDSLSAAFGMFARSAGSGAGSLGRAEVTSMNKYLGFPSSENDITELMKTIDKDGNESISLVEFGEYVGKMGGMGAILEERQKRLGRKSMMAEGELATDKLGAALMACGIDAQQQAYWRMVVPHSELATMSELARCQTKAVATIRRLAKKNHQEALPKLQQRVKKLGEKEDSLWLTLAWIRELAPVLVHINLDKMLQWMEKDTNYRNQFETNSSGGLLKPEVRKKWERDLFVSAYDGPPEAKGHERPKYGVQNVMNDHRGVVKAAQYGDSYIILKDVRLRCTFAPEDSANLKADKLAVLDFYAHVLNDYSDEELKETLKVATSAEAAVLGDSDKVGKMKYKEAQIHGEVRFDKHVERLVVATRHRDSPKTSGEEKRIRAMCEKHGIQWSWMDQEQKRMKAESMHKLGGAEWKERLQKIQSGDDSGTSCCSVQVAEGFCKVGCGRRVCPGVTASGRPFKTCCRGCVMGFGHDEQCGTIDPTKVGPGMCRNGCGRKVAKGVDSKGRRLQTCCRACATTPGTHDASCGKDVAPGMCRMGCGRKVAPGTTASGKPFDTCCKGCALGKEHTPDCQG